MSRVVLLINPSSQSGRAESRWEEIQAVAKKFERKIERIDTLPFGQTREQVKDLIRKKSCDLLLGAGGDGTLTEIFQGMMAAKEEGGFSIGDLPRLGVIPMGTGNNVAKSLGLEPEKGIKHAMEVALFGDDFLMDLGRVDGMYFADAFTIGVDPIILRQRNIDREAISRVPFLKMIFRDYFVYVVSALKKVFTHKMVEATISIDGEDFKFPDLYNLVVNNSKIYAGVFDFSKRTTLEVLQDGVLDLIFFIGKKDYFSKLLIAARIHPVDEKQVENLLVQHSRNLSGKNIVIHLAKPIPSLIDGEEFITKERFEIIAVPKALCVRVPRAH